jgi:hypothetical protein
VEEVYLSIINLIRTSVEFQRRRRRRRRRSSRRRRRR